MRRAAESFRGAFFFACGKQKTKNPPFGELFEVVVGGGFEPPKA